MRFACLLALHRSIHRAKQKHPSTYKRISGLALDALGQVYLSIERQTFSLQQSNCAKAPSHSALSTLTSANRSAEPHSTTYCRCHAPSFRTESAQYDSLGDRD
jgi:hypothetical protein